MNSDYGNRIDTLAQWLFESEYPVIFTGAGISTESGLPDFRGPDGLWTRRDKGLPPKPMAHSWDSVDPNRGHCAIAELQKLNRLKFLISQNVDNLHLKSGIDPAILAELHGNITKLRCTGCGVAFNPQTEATPCNCGKELISSVIHFGMSLPERDLMLSFEHARKSDLFIVVGSSLVVTPAADIPMEAYWNNSRLVIINQGETPLDANAHLLFREAIGDVLPSVLERLKKLIE